MPLLGGWALGSCLHQPINTRKEKAKFLPGRMVHICRTEDGQGSLQGSFLCAGVMLHT